MRVTLQIKAITNTFISLRLVICICQNLNLELEQICQLKFSVFL